MFIELIENLPINEIYMQMFGVGKMHYFAYDQNTVNIVKYYYNLKWHFSNLIYLKM